MAPHKVTIATQGDDKFIVRLPDGMRDRIKSLAKVNGRSANTEMVLALLEAFPEPVVPEIETVNSFLVAALRWIAEQNDMTIENAKSIAAETLKKAGL